MDLSTFQEEVRGLLVEEGSWWEKTFPVRLVKRWELEGSSGGSYRGTESRYHPGEPEPVFTSLDLALERLAPRITYLQYKELVKDVVEHREWREDEYYGDWTRYAEETVELDRFHAWLTERDLLDR